MHYLFLFFISISFIACSNTKQDIYLGTKSNLYWYAINVSDPKPQGDAHLIKKNNYTILIDGGAYYQGKKKLIPFLKRKHIYTLNELIITHPHFDHYGGILAILEDPNFHLSILRMNMPTKKQMENEWWGGSFEDLIKIQKLAKKRHLIIKPIKSGDIINLDNKSFLKVLYIYDGIHTPVGKTDINDMSMIAMLSDNNHKFLFTGDLNKKLGTYLAKNAPDLSADILKVPHHSAEGLAPNSFFDRVNAKQFIVPAPSYFWTNPKWTRSKRVKKYVKEHNIPTFITGKDGTISITSNRFGYFISTHEKVVSSFYKWIKFQK